MKRIHSKNRGFTIIELMIATTVFSMVLLVCTFGILEIGRSYYKGAAINRSQEMARTIMEEVADAVRFQHGDITPAAPGGNSFCIGTARYDYTLFDYYDPDNSPVNPLVRSEVDNCTDPAPRNQAGILGPRMRLQKLSVEEAGSGNEGLYKITVRVAIGDDDYLEAYDDPDGQCKNERLASQFCAVTELETIVLRRV